MAAYTARRHRWWEDEGFSIEAEEDRFGKAELDFRLDRELLDGHNVVVFRGRLRLGDETTPASVHFPPAYSDGGHPAVVAPELRLGRHQDPSGAMCLDHAAAGASKSMNGAEAVKLAEGLWDLWVNHRDRLADREADLPDPRANYYAYQRGSAVTLIDVDVSGMDAGHFRLGAHQLRPLRAAVSQVLSTKPEESTLPSAPGIEFLVGPYEISGSWIRVAEPPPVTHKELEPWVKEHHGRWADEVLALTDVARQHARRPDLPAVLAFVYPDEGPNRGETHDAWLFLVVHPDGKGHMARAFHLRDNERWLRQPHLKPLGARTVAIVGVGALGSPFADLMAKAGLKGLYLVDSDISTHGNRIRHQLDLTDVGRSKVRAIANRLMHVDPWSQISVQEMRLGVAVPGPEEAQLQMAHDAVLEEIEARDLLVNTSAHVITGFYCSRLAKLANRPILHAWVSSGAWGGRILLQRPGESACMECLGQHQADDEDADYQDKMVPQVESDPNIEEVRELGCADPTFTGPGFELTATAAAAARVAVQALLDGDGYPSADFDLVTLNFRDENTAMPTTRYTRLPVHPDCSICN